MGSTSQPCGQMVSGELIGEPVSSGSTNYKYCVYKFNTCGTDRYKCGDYYMAVAYMYFDIPIIGNYIEIPIRGETMIFNEVDS